MVGVYKRVHPASVEDTGHTFQLAYRKWPVGTADDGTGWVMGLGETQTHTREPVPAFSW